MEDIYPFISIFVVIFLIILAIYGKYGERKFWKLARENKEEAIKFFKSNDCWYIDFPGAGRPKNGTWDGPFLFHINGKVVKIYGKAGEYELKQDDFIKSLSKTQFQNINITSIDPILTIEFNSCMGIKLGESKKSVLSIVEYLNLMNEEEKELYELNKILAPKGFDHINTCGGLYSNIESISFYFHNKKLYSISIFIIPNKSNRKRSIDSLSFYLETRFGKCTRKENDFIWSKGHYSLILSDDNPNASPYIHISDFRLSPFFTQFAN